MTSPESHDHELSLVCALLHDPSLIARASRIVESADIGDRVHRAVFDAIQALETRGQTVCLTGVARAVREAGHSLPDHQYDDLSLRVAERVFAAPRWKVHAYAIAESAHRRRLKRTLEKLHSACDDPTPMADLVDRIEADVLKATERRNTGSGPVAIDTVITRLVQHYEEPVIGWSTGFRLLDEHFSLRPGDQTLIAARPGEGKTTMALEITDHLLSRYDDLDVLFVELEMLDYLTAEVLAGVSTGVDRAQLSRGGCQALGDKHQAILFRRLKEMRSWGQRLHIDQDDYTLSRIVSSTRAWYAQVKRRGHRGILIIDYLQLVRGPKGMKREQEVSEISRTLKLLATDLKIPVVALAQLNRESDKGDRKPRPSDLRESGTLEQNADNIIFPWIPNKEKLYERKIVVAKQRRGRTGEYPVSWNELSGRFENTKKCAKCFTENPSTAQTCSNCHEVL